MDTPPEAPKLSRTPSWIMVGFVLGASSAFSLRHKFDPPPPAPAPAVVHKAPAPAPVVAAGVNEAEAVFLKYQASAVWSNDLSEIAIWNSSTGRFSDFFEVLRNGETFYFRAIPVLTRPVIEYADEANVPIRFTETQEQREKRLESVPALFRPQPPKL